MTVSWSRAACQAGLDAMVGLASAIGAGAIWIYSGRPPSSVEDPATGTKLCICTLPHTAFAPATATADGAVAVIQAVASTGASAAGRPGYWRLVDNAGVAVAQAPITMADIAQDARIDIMECIVTMPMQAPS